MKVFITDDQGVVLQTVLITDNELLTSRDARREFIDEVADDVKQEIRAFFLRSGGNAGEL